MFHQFLRAHGTAVDVTQTAGVRRAVHYDPSRSSYQVTDFDNQAEWHIEDTSMRRCDHSPPLAFFDDGRAVILSKSGHIVVYDLQTNTTCQVLSHSDEDAIVAVRLRGYRRTVSYALQIDQSRRRLVVLRRNHGWFVNGTREITRMNCRQV